MICKASNGVKIKSGDKVLVLTGNRGSMWKCDVFSHCEKINGKKIYYTSSGFYPYCVPFNGNQKYCGTEKYINFKKRK